MNRALYTCLVLGLLVGSLALAAPGTAMKKGIVKSIKVPIGVNGVEVECDVPVPDGTDLSLPETGCTVQTTDPAPGNDLLDSSDSADLPGLATASASETVAPDQVTLICLIQAQGVVQACSEQVPLPL